MGTFGAVEARIQECVEYRKRPDSSVAGWQQYIGEKYGLSESTGDKDFAEAGKRMKEQKELEKQAFLNSMEVQMSQIYKDAVEGIIQIKKDNQNTKKLSLSLINQLQEQLNKQPDKLADLVPHITKLIDTINKTNSNETEVLRIMGKWNDLEKQPNQQVNIQNNSVEGIRVEIRKPIDLDGD